MEAEWLTYREAAQRLGSNIEAVRQRAIRSRWPRVLGNDKRAKIQIPEGVTNLVREGNEGAPRGGNDRAPRKGIEGAYERPLIKSLEAHVETLKERLAAADARIAQLGGELAAERAISEAERARTDAERARADKAIAAFAALADRLDALAAANQSGWWRAVLAKMRGRAA